MVYSRKTIWVEEEIREDSYAEFIGSFQRKQEESIWLRIAADGHFAVYLNGELAHFGASADYPWYKLYHKVDITRYCTGNNDLRIVVWYPGRDSQTYIKDKPGLFFEIEQNGEVLLESNSGILSRINDNYKNEYCKIITSQMGFSFYYDNTVKNERPFTASLESEEEREFHLRKTGYLTLGERIPVSVIRTSDGYLVDMQEETVGFLELDFDSEAEQELMIAYGEHLVSGRESTIAYGEHLVSGQESMTACEEHLVSGQESMTACEEHLVSGQVPRRIGDRDFSVEFKAKQGHNSYMNPFRRLAGRYLQVFCDKPLNIRYIGLRPTDRPVKERERRFDDSLLQRIYDVSVNTLQKCMHEHYEDCPWREQAMYTLDSRNQMLCGYYAFDDVDYVKENLFFIARGQRKDGLLSLCFPAGIDFPIPFFSLVYMMQVSDYVEYTKDMDTAFELKPVIDKIRDAFEERMDENGLIPNLPYPYWNFYEWSECSANSSDIEGTPDEPYVKKYDLILNCMYVYFCKLYEKLYGGAWVKAEMLQAIKDNFYNKEKGLYKLSTCGEAYSQLGNSLAILVGLGSREMAEKIIQDETLIEVTLSMNTFYYDALLTYGDVYKEFIIRDIKQKYGHMLEEGATTLWETAKGWQDFDGAGSLCHGWSAVPIYYLVKLIPIRRPL